MTTKSQLEYLGKQSEVARMVEPIGLKEVERTAEKNCTQSQ
jgi:hypothetical protein